MATIICVDCGKPVYGTSKRRQRCDECNVLRKRAIAKQYYHTPLALPALTDKAVKRCECGRIIDDSSQKAKAKCNFCMAKDKTILENEKSCRLCGKPIPKRQMFCEKECAVNYWAELHRKYKTRNFNMQPKTVAFEKSN